MTRVSPVRSPGSKGTWTRGIWPPTGYRYDQVVAESGFDMETLEAAYARPGETGIGDMITDAFRYAVRKAEGPRYEHIHVVVEPLGLIRDSFLKGPITVDDIFRVLSLGLGTDGMPGYPLVSSHITGKDLKDLLEVETTVAKIKNDAHLQLSGVRFSFNPHRVPFDRVTSIAVQNEAGVYEPMAPEKLYRICLNYYTAQMVEYVRTASHGLLSVQPRDRQGRPVTDMRQGIIDTDPLTPGKPGDQGVGSPGRVPEEFSRHRWKRDSRYPRTVPAAGRPVLRRTLVEPDPARRRRERDHLWGNRDRNFPPCPDDHFARLRHPHRPPEDLRKEVSHPGYCFPAQ